MVLLRTLREILRCYSQDHSLLNADHVFNAETKAVEIFIKILKGHAKHDLSFMLYLDNVELVSRLLEFQALKKTELPFDEEVKEDFLSLNIKLQKVDRLFVEEAEFWAKQGAIRKDLFVGWYGQL